MEQTLKNTLMLGCVLLFMVIFWVLFEIQKSNALIELAKDPVASIERGTSDARADFRSHGARFKEIYTEDKGSYMPGLSVAELNDKYERFEGFSFWCGTGFHFGVVALDIEEHRFNMYYVTAYNLELKKLIDNEKNI